MHRPITILTAGLALLTAPAGVQAQTSYEVVRAGDGQMTCEALIGEINSLNQAIRQQAEAAQRNAAARQTAGRLGRGLLAGLAQGATMMGGMGALTGGNPLTGAMASAAVSGVAGELANGASAPSQAAPAAAPVAAETPQQQRLAHLTNLMVNRGC